MSEVIQRFTDKSRSERGVVLIWLSLMLVLLIAVAGLSVDIANWWLQAGRLQNSVDAGAHAGAVFLPGDEPEAQLHARREVARNGFNDGIMAGPIDATVSANQLSNKYQLGVSATAEIDNYFIKLIGLDTQTITRDAIGQFEQPIAMGSPQNKIGNDPVEGDDDSQFWINIGAPQSAKEHGDRYHPQKCSSSSTVECDTSENPDNQEFVQDGYFFNLTVNSVVAGQPLVVQVFDGVNAEVGTSCTAATFPSSSERATLLAMPGPDGLAGTGDEPFTDSAMLMSSAGPWCTGDYQNQHANTSFIVREPDDTPWSNTDNPVIDTSTCQPVELPSINDMSGNGTNDEIYRRLYPEANDTAELFPTYPDFTFVSTWRRWATVCTIPAGSVTTGDYLLQIRTNGDPADLTAYDSTNTKAGENEMALRVGFGGAAATLDGTNVTIAARQRVSIYANANSANTIFYMARVTPADAGRTVRITLYDMGDASSAGTLQFFPPAEGNYTNFTDCAFSRDDGATLSTATNCKLTNVQYPQFNGRVVNADIRLPSDYFCDETDPEGCWITVNAAFSGGVYDTTTWSASILGAPVRLIE